MKSSPTTIKKDQEEKIPMKEESVKENTQEEGESLLLPLLQGLLHKNTPQARIQTSNEINNKSVSSNISGKSLDNNKTNSKVTQPNKSNSDKKMDDNIYSTSHHVEDSGTESGEDLKFIAAGLRDSMQIHSMKDQNDSDLITEVTAALNRLEQSLKEGKDLKLEQSKKNALLNLVGRLQTGLISPEKITAPTPSPGQNPGDDNETSSPEVDARRGSRPGHQRFAKRRNRASRHTVGVSREELADARRYIEEMVMMETLSNCTTPESSAVTPPEFPTPFEKTGAGGEVKNITPETSTLYRPNQFVPSHLKDSSSNQFNNPGGVQMRDKKPKYGTMRQSAHVEQSNPMVEEDSKSKRPLSESYDYSQNPAVKNFNSGKANQFQNPNTKTTSEFNPESDNAVLEKNIYNKTHHSNQPESNPTFSGLRPSAYTAENIDANKANRFSNKKLMMKRANTIDIPKPMKYINDMESDSEAEEHGISSTKSIGLRGTVQVSVKSKPRHVVPQFQPKTENDHKFLAFIQKQSPTNGLGWNNPNRNQSTTVSNWSNKFGNIKNAFETGAIATSGKPPVPASSARTFWKKTETHHPQTDRVIKPPWADRNYNSDVLTGALKAKQQSENQGAHIPKPMPVNKFSHAPMSAFKPVEPIPSFQQAQFQPIHPSSQSSYPVFPSNQTQQSPTRSLFSGRSVSSSSPTSGLPWVTKPTTEHRVLNMAASKFESKSPTSGLQRHGSLREHDQIYQQRIASYNTTRMEQKRPSLPDATQYNQNYQNVNYGEVQSGQQQQKQDFPPHPYTCTDYTELAGVSTYIPERQRDRADSLTNPNSEPLVLTNNRPIISPNVHVKQQQPLKIFDYPSSPDSANHTLNDVTDDELDNGSLTEYKVEAKVMKGPVSQQAVTVSNRTSHVNDDEKYGRNSKAAKNLLNVMKNISNGKPVEKKQTTKESKPIPQSCISPDGTTYQAPNVEPVFPTFNNATTNRMPTYINQQPYQSQTSVPYSTGSHQSQPPTPQSQISSVPYKTQSSVPYSTGSIQSQPSTPQSYPGSVSYQTQSSVPYLVEQPTTPPSSVPYQKQSSLSYSAKQPATPQSQSSSVPYQKQSSIPYSTGSYQSQPVTPQSPQYPNGYYQQNLAYVPSPHQPGLSTKLDKGPVSYQQSQYQQQYASTPRQTYPQNQGMTDRYIEQQKSQVLRQNLNQPSSTYQQGRPSIPQQQQQKQIQTGQQNQFYKQSSQESMQKSISSYQESKGVSQQTMIQKPTSYGQLLSQDQKKPQEIKKPQQNVSVPYQQSKQEKPSDKSVSAIESSKLVKTGQQNVEQKSYSIQETKKQGTRLIGQIQRQNATEVDYQKKIEKKEVQTAVSAKATSDTTKNVTTYSKMTQQKTVNAESQVYKSSQPADTPDIVKSSLSKEDFPILKKFGPARPHLYQPNAYQYPLAKSESTTQAKMNTAQPPINRKFSEPTVVTKFVTPQIVETPSTPLPAAKDEIPANIVFRNIAQFTSMARRSFDSSVEMTSTPKFPSLHAARPNPLSKSDSWHQIVQQQNAMKPPSPKGFTPSEGSPLRRAKSGHSLSIPKMFEAGIDKSEAVEKQKTVAAYFSGQKSPNSLSRNSSQTNIAEVSEVNKSTTSSVSVKKSSISRIKTNEKASISNQHPNTGLMRSQTMPHMANLHLLDETNVDDAFEELLNAS